MPVCCCCARRSASLVCRRLAVAMPDRRDADRVQHEMFEMVMISERRRHSRHARGVARHSRQAPSLARPTISPQQTWKFAVRIQVVTSSAAVRYRYSPSTSQSIAACPPFLSRPSISSQACRGSVRPACSSGMWIVSLRGRASMARPNPASGAGVLIMAGRSGTVAAFSAGSKRPTLGGDLLFPIPSGECR